MDTRLVGISKKAKQPGEYIFADEVEFATQDMADKAIKPKEKVIRISVAPAGRYRLYDRIYAMTNLGRIFRIENKEQDEINISL